MCTTVHPPRSQTQTFLRRNKVHKLRDLFRRQTDRQTGMREQTRMYLFIIIIYYLPVDRAEVVLSVRGEPLLHSSRGAEER